MPRDGTATRARILSAAERLVIDHGFSATSIEEVIAAAGSSKGAFFNHFGSKSDLAHALVEGYVAGDLRQLDAALEATASIADPRVRLLAFLDFFVAEADALMSEQSNCLYVTAVTERQLVRAETSAEIERAVHAWRAAIAGLIRAAAPDEAGRLNPDDLADHVFVTFEGAFIIARATADPGQMRRQLATLRALVAAWLP